MSEKLMLILSAELVAKIDANRGDLSQAEFISYLIDKALNNKAAGKKVISKDELYSIKADLENLVVTEGDIKKKYVTEEESQSYIKDNRKLLKNFIDFFIEYELEMGKQSDKELINMTSMLKVLDEELGVEEVNEVKLKGK